MTTPMLCRLAFIVDDMPSFTQEMHDLMGLEFLTPPVADKYPGMTIRFSDSGLEAIQLHEAASFGADRFIEVGLDFENSGTPKDCFIAAGYKPVMTSYLPVPGAYAYLFGRDFHNLPLMFCTAGTGEIAMRESGPFEALASASMPKIGCVSITVNSIDTVVKDLKQLLGMQFTATDPAGLGSRAVVGTHRVKLVEGTSAFSHDFEPPLAAIEMAVNDVELMRARIEAAGYSVKYTRSLKDGCNAYYFGAISQRIPLGIYPIEAEAEILGLD